jgi:hypothetical protein
VTDTVKEKPNNINPGDEFPDLMKKVKLDQSKSKFASKELSKQEKFEEVAKETHERREQRKLRMYELGAKFIGMINDKTLFENKGPTERAAEKQVIGDLVVLAIEINNDQGEKEGIGSIGLITAMFNCLLKVRDVNNALGYELEQIRNRMVFIETNVVNKVSDLQESVRKNSASLKMLSSADEET